MGRHRTPEEKEVFRLRAAQMRAAGIGGKRIAKELGIGGALASELLRGVPVPGALTRAQAKDEVRDAAVLLRQQGRTYSEISDELGVSKSSLSLWLRDLDFPTQVKREAISMGAAAESQDVPDTDPAIARTLRSDGWLLREIAAAMGVAVKTAFLWTEGIAVPPRAMHGRTPDEVRAMGRAYWDAKLAEREIEREAVMSAAADWVGELTPRELELVAVTAYWCEGGKSKPWRRTERLTFINSDPDLIRLWLRWLRLMGVNPEHLAFRVHIHESADVAAATEFWAEVVGFPSSTFARATLKRHNPRTVRKNNGDDYRGCLIVSTQQSRLLYQRMAGIWRGIVAGVVPSAADS